ncbi:hypothetical protein VTK73DRAFT_8828 [Phialemonium thermophilum]|uniref:Phosphate transporter n=1 Tax=Phialemonium thermophilum TaxID=223376 RepID=A0ABR3W5Y2_9PEZI
MDERSGRWQWEIEPGRKGGLAVPSPLALDLDGSVPLAAGFFHVSIGRQDRRTRALWKGHHGSTPHKMALPGHPFEGGRVLLRQVHGVLLFPPANMTLHQFDYLFAIGTIFAFLDAWNIGANDVANSWATSVGSRSVTYLQAMALATVMEFSGSMGVGARVADTIRTKVVDTSLFTDDPAILMLGMVCAVVASSTYLTVATRLGFPVSTTHSIMGGVIGMGIASVGTSGIQWVGKGSGTGVINAGVVQVFLAWIIAPGLSGCFGAIIFLLTKSPAPSSASAPPGP